MLLKVNLIDGQSAYINTAMIASIFDNTITLTNGEKFNVDDIYEIIKFISTEIPVKEIPRKRCISF